MDSPTCCPFSKLFVCHSVTSMLYMGREVVPGPASHWPGIALSPLCVWKGNGKSFLHICYKNNLQVTVESINHFYAQMKRIVPGPEKMHLLGPMFQRHKFVSLIVYLSQQCCLNNTITPLQWSFPIIIAKHCNTKAIWALLFPHAWITWR